MERKTLFIIFIVLVLGVMAYFLYGLAREQIETSSSAPYPLSQVDVSAVVKPESSETMTSGSTKINVAPNFSIVPNEFRNLPMYEFNPDNKFTEDFANNISKNLGLDTLANRQDPELGKVIISGKDTKNLVIYLDSGELTYTDTHPQTVQGGAKFGANPDVDFYKPKGEDFIKDLGLQNSSFVYDSYSYVISNSEHATVTQDARAANMIQLKYVAKIKDLSIIDKNNSLLPNTMTIWMTSNGGIAKVFYQASGQIRKPYGNYSLLSRDEVRADLQTGKTKAKLVNGNYQIGENIESINITKAHVSYLSVDNYLVPVYILEADVRTANNNVGTGYLLLEAIKK